MENAPNHITEYEYNDAVVKARLSTLEIASVAIAAHSRMADHSDDSWQAQALCARVDYELFFPEKGGSARDAKKVCARCPVQEQCLNAALSNGESFGIWGGYTERERRKLQK
jgi:WhiB family redox-sensing transcriptional regulator